MDDTTKETEEAIFQKKTNADKSLSYLVCIDTSSNHSLLKNTSQAYKSHRNENRNQGKLEEIILLGKNTVHKEDGLKQCFDNGNNTRGGRKKTDGKTKLKKNSDPSTNTCTNQTTKLAPTDDPT